MFRRTVLILSLAVAATAAAACGSSAKSSGTTSSSIVSSAPGSTSAAGSSAPGSASGSSSAAPSSSAPAVGPSGGPVPAGFKPTSVTFVDADHGWVLGTAPCSTAPCTSVVRTRDGGRTWQGIPAPKAPIGSPYMAYTPGEVTTIRFADQSNGWIVGSRLYATHDGGASWHPASVGATGGQVNAVGTSAGRVYATRLNCPGDAAAGCQQSVTVYSAALTSDSWSAVSSAVTGARQPGLVVAKSGWYLPASDGIHRGPQTGVLPNPCPAEAGSRPSPTLAVVDATHLDAMCAGEGAAGSAMYQLYGSTDGGQHWKADGSSRQLPSDLTGLADNAGGVLLVAAASGNSAIYRSTDDGVTLPAVLTASGGGLPWNDLGFTTPQQAVAILNGVALYLSHDAGRTWSTVRF